jgi:hypothetical protein
MYAHYYMKLSTYLIEIGYPICGKKLHERIFSSGKPVLSINYLKKNRFIIVHQKSLVINDSNKDSFRSFNACIYLEIV